MIIQCDQCDRKFRVDDSKIKAPGSRVRCSKCGNVFFVEKKDSAKTDEKPAEAASTNQDNLNVGTDANQDTQPSESEVKVNETSAADSSVDVKAPSPAESGNNEQVWSIDEEQASPESQVESPSIEIDLNADKSTENEPSEQDTEPQQEQSQDNSFSLDIDKPDTDNEEKAQSPSWAALDVKDDNKPSDDDLTPPEQPPADFNPAPAMETNQTEPQITQSVSEDSPTDPSQQQQPEEPSLDIDMEKANQVDQQQAFESSQPYEDILSSDLSVDQQKMSEMQAESFGVSSPDADSGYETQVVKSTYKPQKKSAGSKVGSFITKIVAVLCILVILASFGLILAVNLEILPKEQSQKLRSFLVANLPIDINNPLEGINVTTDEGQWINSSNGPLFVVTGNITNITENIVNYIKLKAEFLNNGQIIYEANLYAGNTFTSQELQTLPLSKLNERLNRKNGDIDFSDPRKLAGTNYNLMPGDSIKFYSIFPSNTQILGLKYNVEVIDAELIIIDNSQ